MDRSDTKAFQIALHALNPDNLDELMALASNDPLQVALKCQNSFSVLETTLDKPLNQLIAVGYAVAYRLKESPQDLQAFAARDCWVKPFHKVPTDDAILRVVFRFLKQAWRRGSAYDTACRYTVALRHSFQNAVSPSQIPILIKNHGGIEKLYSCEVDIRRGVTTNHKQPHRNGAVPRNAELEKLLADSADPVPRMTDEEDAAWNALTKFQNDFRQWIQSHHEHDET